ncbi:hypothetical protein P2Q00_22665 [Streptomyces coacervatus]|nr:hypothetical protein [Streptomyces coacervatus]MDF2268219.1 hypothetical protein [Streptomyces coacervatus]
MLTTFPLHGCSGRSFHLLLFNVELEFRRQKGDATVNRAAYEFPLDCTRSLP